MLNLFSVRGSQRIMGKLQRSQGPKITFVLGVRFAAQLK